MCIVLYAINVLINFRVRSYNTLFLRIHHRLYNIHASDFSDSIESKDVLEITKYDFESIIPIYINNTFDSNLHKTSRPTCINTYRFPTQTIVPHLIKNQSHMSNEYTQKHRRFL